MPFTPFHFGPGILIRSVERRFSFIFFVISQVIMDLEPLYFMIRSDWPAHRLFHTFLGCDLAALITVLIGKTVCEIMKIRVTWKTAIFSALIGTWSHVFLDGLMHRDMRPFWPFGEQTLTGFVSGEAVMGFCFICFVVGLVIYGLKTRKRI